MTIWWWAKIWHGDFYENLISMSTIDIGVRDEWRQEGWVGVDARFEDVTVNIMQFHYANIYPSVQNVPFHAHFDWLIWCGGRMDGLLVHLVTLEWDAFTMEEARKE